MLTYLTIAATASDLELPILLKFLFSCQCRAVYHLPIQFIQCAFLILNCYIVIWKSINTNSTVFSPSS